MTKTKRNLSGVYFRYHDPQSNESGRATFEDLPLEEQNKIMEGYDREKLQALILHLANTLNRIGDDLDLRIP